LRHLVYPGTRPGERDQSAAPPHPVLANVSSFSGRPIAVPPDERKNAPGKSANPLIFLAPPHLRLPSEARGCQRGSLATGSKSERS
jgi:hypothetical protein